jgi:Glycosyl transferase family 2
VIKRLFRRQGHADAPAAQSGPAFEQMARQLAGLSAEVRRLTEEQQRLVAGQAEMQTRVRRAQALIARTYEALQGWPELLAAARRSERYEAAYTDRDPLISIPIPTYNSPATLCERSLASVLAQTHRNWEAVVVGDHCTDDTAERVAALGDRRIRFHNLPFRERDPADPWERWAIRGSVARSAGIAMSSGRWIAPLSHDDAWDEDHLEMLLAAARERRAEVVYARMRVLDADHPQRGVIRTIGAYPPRHGEFGWQAAVFHGELDFLRYDRNCALASEPNDWNLARRAWEAAVRFHHVPRETVTLYVADRVGEISRELAAQGLPPEAAAGHA